MRTLIPIQVPGADASLLTWTAGDAANGHSIDITRPVTIYFMNAGAGNETVTYDTPGVIGDKEATIENPTDVIPNDGAVYKVRIQDVQNYRQPDTDNALNNALFIDLSQGTGTSIAVTREA